MAARRQGDTAVKRLIDAGLRNTTVTVVCIGAQTAGRRYINYEIQESIERGNGIVGIQIHHLEDNRGPRDSPGAIPALLRNRGYKSYKYVDRVKLARRIEEAARDAGK